MERVGAAEELAILFRELPHKGACHYERDRGLWVTAWGEETVSGVAAVSLWAWRSAIAVAVGVADGVTEGVTVGVAEGITVGVAVGDGVGVGVAPAAQKISIDASGVTPSMS